jgi:hypothetical protein
MFLLCHIAPNHHYRAFVVAPENRSRHFLAVLDWWRTLSSPVRFLQQLPPLFSSADSKKGESSMMVQPRTFLVPYTCCYERSTPEQCPAFSRRSCRTRSLWSILTSSSGSLLTRILLWVHAPLGIVHAPHGVVQLYWECSEVATP